MLEWQVYNWDLERRTQAVGWLVCVEWIYFKLKLTQFWIRCTSSFQQNLIRQFILVNLYNSIFKVTILFFDKERKYKKCFCRIIFCFSNYSYLFLLELLWLDVISSSQFHSTLFRYSTCYHSHFFTFLLLTVIYLELFLLSVSDSG